MKGTLYTSGQRVILKANKREGWPEQHGFFVSLSGKTTALVQVEPLDTLDDDDGLREVALTQIKPFYAHPSDRKRRAKLAARKFKMGVRFFRLDKPDGRQFCVEAVEGDVAFGRLFKRKTIQEVPLHSLWPDLR